jgi:hypothetical protein
MYLSFVIFIVIICSYLFVYSYLWSNMCSPLLPLLSSGHLDSLLLAHFLVLICSGTSRWFMPKRFLPNSLSTSLIDLSNYSMDDIWYHRIFDRCRYLWCRYAWCSCLNPSCSYHGPLNHCLSIAHGVSGWIQVDLHPPDDYASSVSELSFLSKARCVLIPYQGLSFLSTSSYPPSSPVSDKSSHLIRGFPLLQLRFMRRYTMRLSSWKRSSLVDDCLMCLWMCRPSVVFSNPNISLIGWHRICCENRWCNIQPSMFLIRTSVGGCL